MSTEQKVVESRGGGAHPIAAETQRQRWMKYGVNVALVCVIGVALAVVVTWIAQRHARRIDMTGNRVYSLKPQTINIIKDLKQPIKLVSLYHHAEPGEEASADTDYAQTVSDLLDEYRRQGKNISVEVIDPVANPTKVNDLINDVTTKYGGEVQKYRQATEEAKPQYEQIKKLAGEEIAKIAALPLDNLSDELQETAGLAILTVREIPKVLDRSEEVIQRRTQQKIPDYKGAVDSIQQSMETLSSIGGRVVEDFQKYKTDRKVPEVLRNYMADSLGQYQQMKKIADDLLAKLKNLGDLKLDDLRQRLRERDAILVMGEKDMRSLPFEKVWQMADQDVKAMANTDKIRPRFAGEQQISTAILSLASEKKPKVAFIRPGGAPLTTPGFPPFQQGGPFSEIAQRLRDYNFEVLEKDMSGQWAMQAQMRGMPAEPEPSDQDIKDAVWIVINYRSGGEGPMGMTPDSIGPKLAEHLMNGGSALVLVAPQASDLSVALKDWGIEVKPNAIAVHEKIESGDSAQGDFVEEAKRLPFIFDITNYGDHLLAQPLNRSALHSWLVGMVVVKSDPQAKGHKVTPLLPIPRWGKTWGATDLEALESGGEVKFDAARDVAGPATDRDTPLYAGAASESEKGGRVVVIGSPAFAMDRILNIPDPTLAKRRIFVSRFPGNAELFLNSVYWLEKMEPMIAISPAAMEVSRLREMGSGELKMWRGVLLAVIPGAVILAGLGVYLRRRD